MKSVADHGVLVNGHCGTAGRLLQILQLVIGQISVAIGIEVIMQRHDLLLLVGRQGGGGIGCAGRIGQIFSVVVSIIAEHHSTGLGGQGSLLGHQASCPWADVSSVRRCCSSRAASARARRRSRKKPILVGCGWRFYELNGLEVLLRVPFDVMHNFYSVFPSTESVLFVFQPIAKRKTSPR